MPLFHSPVTNVTMPPSRRSQSFDVIHVPPEGANRRCHLYRTRLVSTRIPEREKRELAELAKSRPDHEWDPDACRAMLFAVLETAIRDYEYLASLCGRRSAAQSKRARSMIEDNDPREFFSSTWFEEICHLLGLDHEAVRTTVDDRIAEQQMPQVRGSSEAEALRA